MLKREARHPGEIGLFPTDPMSADDFAALPSDRDVFVTTRSARNPRQHRFAWALATKLADACDFLHDKRDAMNLLCIKARHVSIVHDPKAKRTHFVPKSIAESEVDGVEFDRLLKRFVWIVVSDILPGLKESDLTREIEEMISPGSRVGDNTR